MAEEKEWSSTHENVFLKFAYGNVIDNPKNTGDYRTFCEFCDGMTYPLHTIPFKEYLCDAINDFRLPRGLAVQEMGFISAHLQDAKDGEGMDKYSYDRIVRALIWLYDPYSPVNRLHMTDKDEEARVQMACRLAGIIDGSSKATFPPVYFEILEFSNDLILTTAMCFKHILQPLSHRITQQNDNLILKLSIKLDIFIEKVTNPKDIESVAKVMSVLMDLQGKLEKQYDKLYGSVDENTELRRAVSSRRRKDTVGRVTKRQQETLTTYEDGLEDDEDKPDWME